MQIRNVVLIAGAALVTGAIALGAAPAVSFKPEAVRIPVPGSYFHGTDAKVLNQNCAACHSAGFVNRQPVQQAAIWTGEVTKMKKAFGAPYTTAEIPKIVDALLARQKQIK